MGLKVAELVAELVLDSKNADRDLDRHVRELRRALERGYEQAARAAADRLSDGVERGGDEAVSSLEAALRSSRSRMERVGETVGEAFAQGVSSAADDVAPLDASRLSGSRSEFSTEGDQLGRAFADGVSSGARGVSAGIDPTSLGGDRAEFNAEGERLGEALADGIETGAESGMSDDAMGGFLDALPAALTSPATAAGAAIAGAMVVGMEEAFASEATQAKLTAALDLSTSDAGKVGEVQGRLMRAGFERAEVAEAITAVWSTLDESNSSSRTLEDLTTQALAFSSAMDTDVTSAVSAVGIMLKEGVVKDAQEGFDLLSEVMSNAPADSRDEIIEASKEYAQFFAGLGFDGPKAYGILAAAAERGQYVVDKLPDSLKEIINTNRDMSDATRQAYADVGLDADDMRAKLLAGGPAAEEAMTRIATALLGVEDPAARSANAVAIFGTPFEDVAGNVDALNGTLSALASEGMTEFDGASQRNVDSVNTMESKVAGYVNTAKGLLGSYVGGTIAMIGDAISTNLAQIDWFTERASGAWNTVSENAQGMAFNVAASLGSMVETVAGLPGRIAEAAARMWDGVKASFRGMLQQVAKGWNALSFTIPSVDVPGIGKVGGQRIDFPDISVPEFHTGGIVGGTPGREVLAALMPGEMVLTRDQQLAITGALNADLSGAMLGAGASVPQVLGGGAGGAASDPALLAKLDQLLANLDRPNVSLTAPIQTTSSPEENLRLIELRGEQALAVAGARR